MVLIRTATVIECVVKKLPARVNVLFGERTYITSSHNKYANLSIAFFTDFTMLYICNAYMKLRKEIGEHA